MTHLYQLFLDTAKNDYETAKFNRKNREIISL